MYVLLHNPRCSKSREALSLLTERGVNFTVRNYFDTPLSVEELTSLLKRLGIPARDLLRTKEPEYQELGLVNPTLADNALIEAMIHHPRLMERPILDNGEQARIGRPTERLLEILP